MIEIINPNFEFGDDRGNLIQLVRDGYKQVNYIYSKENAIRGMHYHMVNEEAFYVIKGELRLTCIEFDNNIKSEYIFKTGDMFVIHPKTIHQFAFVKDTHLISMYSKGVELIDGTKDIISAMG